MTIQDGLNSVMGIIQDHPVGSTVVGGGAAVGAVLGTTAIIKRKRKKKSKRSYSRKKRSARRNRRRKRSRRTPYTARKRKDRSHKRIRYTKTGQPYIIMASGKARFISKRGAKMSRKRKGGRY